MVGRQNGAGKVSNWGLGGLDHAGGGLLDRVFGPAPLQAIALKGRSHGVEKRRGAGLGKLQV